MKFLVYVCIFSYYLYKQQLLYVLVIKTSQKEINYIFLNAPMIAIFGILIKRGKLD